MEPAHHYVARTYAWKAIGSCRWVAFQRLPETASSTVREWCSRRGLSTRTTTRWKRSISSRAFFSQVSQGITTIVLGQDGGSAWPVGDWLDARRQHPAAVNVLTLIGQATIRRKVMGDDFRRAATAEEVARMAKLVEQAMGEGAVGLSTGLEYEVGSYSTTEEVIALARAAARQHGIYVSHVRDEADKTFDAFREILRIGDEAQLPVQISHIKLGTLAVWGKAGEAVRLIEQARSRGVDVTADWYPYDAWSSTITVLVPDKNMIIP